MMRKITSRNIKRLLLGLMIIVGLFLVAYPFVPGLLYELDEWGIIGEQNKAFVLKPISDNYTVRAQTDEYVLLGPSNNTNPNSTASAGASRVATARDRIEQRSYLVIPKIGVDIDITQTDNEDYGLAQGAWLMPQASTPDKGGNTVLSAHRYKYLPPSSKTFYLLHKLENGDTFTVVWQGKEYRYRVSKKEVVSPYALEVLNPTQRSVVKLLTCEPIFSTANRLVVTGELIEVI